MFNMNLLFCVYLLGTAQYQWRSKALRGPGSTVTWGPPFPSPPLHPPSPFPPLPQPSALLLPRSGVQIQLEGLGERCKLPSEVWGGAPAKIEFGAF